MNKINDDMEIQHYMNASVSFVQLNIRTSYLINSGAIVAVLAIIGHLSQKNLTPAVLLDLKSALYLFVGAMFTTAMMALLGHLLYQFPIDAHADLKSRNKSLHAKADRYLAKHVVGLLTLFRAAFNVAIFMPMFLFSIGSFKVIDAIPINLFNQ